MSDDATRAVQAFNAHLDELAENAGVELGPEERQRIFGMSVAGGFSRDATVGAFGEFVDESQNGNGQLDDDDWEDDEEPGELDDLAPGTRRLVEDFAHDLEKLEQKIKRPVSERERDQLIRSAREQATRHDKLDVEGAFDEYSEQFATPQGRQEFFQRRMQESRPEPQVRDEYDLDKDSDRAAYYDARLNGGVSADDFEDAPDEAA